VAVKPKEGANEKATTIVVNGPSGVGKGTLINKLMADFPTAFGFSVSHTTRGPRPGEENGVHYHFSTREEMEPMIADGQFLEHADVHGNIYGTSKAAVQKVVDSGKICILDIDVQGADTVRKSGMSGVQYVFVKPPSMQGLEDRLRGRGTETEEKIQKRLKNAAGEMEYADKPGYYEKVITNDDLEKAYKEFCAFVGMQPPAAAPAADSGEKAKVLFILGPPGAGKGTQCDNLVKEFDYMHISAGDCLREEKAKPDSPDAELINGIIKEGKLVPVEITLRLMKKKMDASSKTKFLIDGFPRNIDNKEGWEREIGEAVKLQGVINFECSEDILTERILERGKTSGRSDDNLESLKKRFTTFYNETMPVVQWYEDNQATTGVNVLRIDATKDKETVWGLTKDMVNKM